MKEENKERIFGSHNTSDKENKRKKDLKVFKKISEEIKNSDYFTETKTYKHHGGTNTVYKHSLRVGYKAYQICRLLDLDAEKTKSVVEAALLHDIFGYRWRNDPKDVIRQWKSDKGFNKIAHMHPFYHGTLAANNVSKYIDLTDNQKEAIIKHMFPLYPIPPRHIEGWIVTISDKIVASREMTNTVFYTLKKGGIMSYEWIRKHKNNKSN